MHDAAKDPAIADFSATQLIVFVDGAYIGGYEELWLKVIVDHLNYALDLMCRGYCRA